MEKILIYVACFCSLSIAVYSVIMTSKSNDKLEQVQNMESEIAKEIWLNREINFTLIDEVARMDRVKFDSLLGVNRYRRYLTDLTWKEKSLQDSIKKYPNDTMYAAQYMVIKSELDKFRQ